MNSELVSSESTAVWKKREREKTGVGGGGVVFLCHLSCSGTHSVEKAGFRLTEIHTVCLSKAGIKDGPSCLVSVFNVYGALISIKYQTIFSFLNIEKKFSVQKRVKF